MAHIVSPVTTVAISIAYPSTAFPDPPTYTSTSGPSPIDGKTRTENGYAFFTSNFRLVLPRGAAPRKGILAVHGKGVTSADVVPSFWRWADYLTTLADSGGYAILAPDHGSSSYGNALAMVALDAAYTYLTDTVLGTTGAKVGMVGSSMGALACLNWTRLNTSKVAAVWLGAPLLDLDLVHQTVGYTAPWTIPVDAPNSPLYQTVVDRSASVNGAFLVPYPGYLSGPSPYDATYWADNVVAKNWNAVNAQPSLWRGLNVPIRVNAAQRDATVPYQMAQWWVTAVNDPKVTMRSPVITYPGADHPVATWGAGNTNGTPTGLTDSQILAAGGLPRYELRDFFQQTLG